MRIRRPASIAVPLAAALVFVGAPGRPGPSAATTGDVADVAVESVVLFSSGVGYFEHGGTVSGNVATELRFKSEQINDILKSLVVEDRDGGRVTTIAYPSQDPIAKTLRSFEVDISGNPSLGELLSQLRGAAIAVATVDRSLEGTILGTEQVRRVVNDRGDTADVWVLNLLTGTAVRSIALDDVRELEIRDAELAAELDKALAALAQARDQDQKPVVINFEGTGKRRVRLGYVVEAPVWKTSYRLVLGQDKVPHRLQAWAIVENQTDNDWNAVDLTLVSGRPLGFVQDLYRPLYIPRPVVEPERYASLAPQTYDDGRENKKVARRGSAPAALGQSPGVYADMEVFEEDAALAMASAPLDATRGVQSLAAAEKVGEFFQYTVPGVSLPRQRSAMIPIVTDEVTLERLSIYNARTLAKNPLLGARLTNSTGKHLPAGPVTVFDGGAYAGDARVDDLPPGQNRLLSFAIDQQVRVMSEGSGTTSTLMTGRLSRGVLKLQRRQVMSRAYQLENKGESSRTVLVEHTVRPGWYLVDTPAPVETTGSLYRFRQALAPEQAATLTVKEERVNRESVALVPLDVKTVLYWQNNGRLSPEVRSALAKVAKLKGDLVDSERRVRLLEEQRAAIATEQDRIRANMKAVGDGTAYYRRLLDKLNGQETELEQLLEQQDDLRSEVETRRQALTTFVEGLELQ